MRVINPREQRQFVRFMAGELKNHSREVAVYRIFTGLLKQAGCTGVDELLEIARCSPGLEAKLQENFADLDALVPPPDPDHSEREKELLAKWKPKSELPN
jgi:hypothetical protein